MYVYEYLGADHLIPGGGGIFRQKKIVQETMENK